MKQLILGALILTISGCSLLGLKYDLQQFDASSEFSGRITNNNGSDAPVIVLLSQYQNGHHQLQDYTIVYGSGDFLLRAPEGAYYLFAFEDKNHDFTLQENERAAWYGNPSLLTASSGQSFTKMDLRLLAPELVKARLPSLFQTNTKPERLSKQAANIATVVTPAFFKPDIGTLGLWQPIKFHQQGHSGVYLLEPFDPNKIPVMFVHGMGGSGYDWRYLVSQLDREHFQPWLVQYPSGLRLGLLSKTLNQTTNQLSSNFGFKQLIVVAHSMGGLVSRGFINHHQSDGSRHFSIPSFVSISTPWLGHSGAAKGVKYSPVAIPSWFDLSPGSPYLTSLSNKKLPPTLQHYLMFSHNGREQGLLSSQNSDGTVTLSSQLPQKIQAEAIRVIGFDQTHTGVLKSQDVANHLNKILAKSLLR